MCRIEGSNDFFIDVDYIIIEPNEKYTLEVKYKPRVSKEN